MPKVHALPKERRHTYYFLNEARQTMPVVISTEVDMMAINNFRMVATETKISYITFLICAISKVLAHHKQVNATFMNKINPKLACFNDVSAKFTLDKMINNCRAVVSAVIQNSHKLSLKQIQEYINYYRDNEFETIEEFAALRKLQKLPVWLGRLVYRLIMSRAKNKQAIHGTFTITSLGNKQIQNFIPMGTTALTFGVGQITDKAIVTRGKISIRPILCLNMVFDHRVLDGAMASDILQEIKQNLEIFKDA